MAIMRRGVQQSVETNDLGIRLYELSKQITKSLSGLFLLVSSKDDLHADFGVLVSMDSNASTLRAV